MSILQKINGHDDLTALDDRQRTQLCGEIREFLVSNVSKTGGHLAGNLGVVELSVAIETVFNTEIDRLVFDVGHQSYVHKLLTGRQADFPHLRQYGGLSGFPKPSESDTDAFVAGHASSSVSIALGMARARTLLHQDYNVVALIGDGACTGGMAYEGLNDAAVSGEPMVIILNDNEMSIGRNVGGVSRHLSRLRSSGHYLKAKRWYREIMKKTAVGRAAYRVTRRLKNRLKRFLLPASLFENMGFTYLGPVDGHDLPGLISLLTTAKGLAEPVVVHVVTKKGCGYRFAEEDPAKFHGIGAFDPETGKKLAKKITSYSDSFGEAVMELAQKDDRICAITAAMPGGTGLLKFMREYPKRFFDVGIAEEHAISMAGGLAKQGMVPVAAIYSTFLQRAYDQIMQDIAMLHLHVILAVDRAGLVGDDGATHHGVFDVGFLRQVPGMLILAPASLAEQKDISPAQASSSAVQSALAASHAPFIVLSRIVRPPLRSPSQNYADRAQKMTHPRHKVYGFAQFYFFATNLSNRAAGYPPFSHISPTVIPGFIHSAFCRNHWKIGFSTELSTVVHRQIAIFGAELWIIIVIHRCARRNV